ncbi:uncharacterized protein [Miscanthus floridulus]|uniref:uncharacterized protein isoform X2 n=1 Tax=Miscanthus floridulus TaxID=154761 RepID=UPI003458E743
MRLSAATAMPRELSMVAAAAPAMAPTASVDEVVSFKFLFQFLTKHALEAKVFAAWALWFLLRYLQSILGPMRSRSGHWLVYYGAMAAYYLPTVIAFSAASAVYSSESDDLKAILIVGCSILLFSSARGAVTMTAFSLEHGPVGPQSWQLLPWLLYFAWVQLDLIRSNGQMELAEVMSFVIFFIAPLLYLVLAKPRSRASKLDQKTKEVADYMVRVSRSSSPAPFFRGDATRRLYDRCRYSFVKLKNGRWITFSNVLQQLCRLPRDCAVDPDTCLAYSFCRLLARRYFGFPCAEDGNEQLYTTGAVPPSCAAISWRQPWQALRPNAGSRSKLDRWSKHAYPLSPRCRFVKFWCRYFSHYSTKFLPEMWTSMARTPQEFASSYLTDSPYAQSRLLICSPYAQPQLN